MVALLSGPLPPVSGACNTVIGLVDYISNNYYSGIVTALPHSAGQKHLRHRQDNMMSTNRERSQGHGQPVQPTMLELATEQSPALVLITDRSGHIVYVNSRFTELTGYTAEDVIGKTPRILKSGSVSAETYRLLWNTILSGKEWHSEILNRKRDGTLYWQRSAISSIRDDSGTITHFLEMAEDISREKELERELIQSQKMEAIGKLAGGVAHDFNNMLTVIISLSEMIKAGVEENGELYGYAQSVLSAARKSSALTNQLLAFSRRQVLRREVLDLNGIVCDMERMVRSLVDDNIRLVTRLRSNVGPVLLDRSQIEQVILNLCVNAKEAISNDGIIVLETEAITGGTREVGVSEFIGPGDYVCLSVSDTGAGIDEETLRHIYEPFYTTKGNGTGLGLSIVYGIVHQNDGRIHVESDPGKGTTFRIYLPVVDMEALDTPDVERGKEGVQGSETILLVEDDDNVRSTVNEILVKNGYSVILCANAEHAIAFCEADSRDIELLITDVVLPDTDGVALFGELHALYPDLPVLFISGYAENLPTLQHEIDTGRSFLPKPFGAHQLLDGVRHALKGKTPERVPDFINTVVDTSEESP